MFCGLTRPLVDRVLSGCLSDARKHLMLNNVVNGFQLNCTDLIDNYVLFAVRRDPRSQYVALKNEDKKELYYDITTDIGRFIRWYRQSQLDAERRIERPHKRGTLELVQFEKLITSEHYRRSLTEKAGRDLLLQDEYTFLKPWESEKNLQNYRSFAPREEIERIEKELPEYCWDE